MKVFLSSLAGALKPLKRFMMKAVDLGFNNIEIVDEWNHRLDSKKVRELNELKKTYSLNYVVHAPFDGINISTPQNALRAVALKLIEDSIRHAYEIDAKLVVIHSGFISPLDFLKPKVSWNLFLDSLKRLNKLANDLDIYVGVENMPSDVSAAIRSYKDAIRFMEEIHALEMLGLTLDIGHTNTINTYEARDYLLRVGDRILHLHLHDNDGKSDGHLAVGSGTVNWALILPLVKGLKLVGGLTIEVMNFKDVQKSFSVIDKMLR
ncbi:MAG: sugar phosphate isomerase/epimerase [Candidatus Nezhaarchaeales archaeon]